MSEKCGICGGDQRPMMLVSPPAGWEAHNVYECLLELRRRIEVLEKSKEKEEKE